MTQEDKDLLLKDLCTRLPYMVKCYAYQPKIDGNDCECCGTFEGILHGRFYLSDRISINGGKTYDEYYLEVKPYLRPMESMTEEERKEYRTECNKVLLMRYRVNNHYPVTDWLNAHHFDYRGLIPMGLALPATEEMYNN